MGRLVIVSSDVRLWLQAPSLRMLQLTIYNFPKFSFPTSIMTLVQLVQYMIIRKHTCHRRYLPIIPKQFVSTWNQGTEYKGNIGSGQTRIVPILSKPQTWSSRRWHNSLTVSGSSLRVAVWSSYNGHWLVWSSCGHCRTMTTPWKLRI